MGRTVLLRHELPDGTSHYDWMIQPRPGAGLITFRVADRIDLEGGGEFLAERLADHRAEYLDYEGAVSGDRGRVVRLAAGELAISEVSNEWLACEGALGRLRARFLGRAAPDGWHFSVEPVV